ncbi:MAG: hypothetical protein AAB653_02905 [Patescibacteria group bacterium]
MFVLKRPSNKKIITYFIIIFSMVSSGIFLFYYDRQLTSKNPLPIFLPVREDIAAPEAALKIDQIASGTEAKIDNSNGQDEVLIIDSTILKSKKYQALKDNSILSIDSKIKVGKKNPFEPYK